MSSRLVIPPRPAIDGARGAAAVGPPPSYLEKSVALAALFLFGMRPQLIPGLHVGVVLALALAPVWIPRLRRYGGASIYVVVGLAAAVAGVVLTDLSSVDHATSPLLEFVNTMLLIGLLAGVGLVIWAREVVGTPLTAAAFGLGLLTTAIATPALHGDNPWKFALGIPIIVAGMALVAAYRLRVLQIFLLLLFAIVSGLADSRSYLAELALAALLLMLAAVLLTRRQRIHSPMLALLGIVIGGLIVYYAGTAFLVEGLFGTEAQIRTVEQIDRAGSVLLGARPELGATIALMAVRFEGFGAGTLASGADIQVAKEGMTRLNYAPDNGYVNGYMFGEKIELHSVAGDLWAIAGPVGLLFALVSVAILLRYLSHAMTGARVTGVVVFLAIITLWNLGFGPLYTSSWIFPLAIGLALLPRRPQPFPVGRGSPR